MKRILLMSLLAISTALSAQKPVELELWPDGAPNSNGITTPEQKLENNRISNVSEPAYWGFKYTSYYREDPYRSSDHNPVITWVNLE